MSGIAGIVYPDLFHVHMFMDQMLETLSHRGSTQNMEHVRDMYTYKNVRLGVSGKQIASNPRKSTIALLDGNIYNYNNLITLLKNEGFQFDTPHSSELIVHAYDHWGEKFVTQLEGDFSAAIFDRTKNTLYLYRDRVGVRPIYWYAEQDYFIFASEIKAILATGIVPQTPALDSIALYLSLGYVPQDVTLIKNLNKLLPAHYLTYNIEKGLGINPYWSYAEAFMTKSTDSPKDAEKKLEILLTKSVKERLVPNTTPGCFLSGGIGSASIAATIREQLPYEDIPSFSCGFQDEFVIDMEAANQFSSALYMKHHSGVVTPETLLNDFVQISWYLDEPLADPNVVATWNMCRLASDHVKYVYSGMGSDELLAGHGRYTTKEQDYYLSIVFEKLKRWLIRYFVIPYYMVVKPTAAFSLLKHAHTNLWLANFLSHQRIFDTKELNKACPIVAGNFSSDIFLHKFHQLSDIPTLVSAYLYLDFKTRLPDLYIAQFEKLTIANGLDWRAPFLSKDIIEYLGSFPEPSSLSEEDTATLLKNLLQTTFSNELINRPKKTRKEFLNSWVYKTVLPFYFQQLENGTLVESGILSKKWILMHSQNEKLCERNFRQLWTLLALEVWFKLFINYPVESTCPNMTLKELITNP